MAALFADSSLIGTTQVLLAFCRGFPQARARCARFGQPTPMQGKRNFDVNISLESIPGTSHRIFEDCIYPMHARRDGKSTSQIIFNRPGKTLEQIFYSNTLFYADSTQMQCFVNAALDKASYASQNVHYMHEFKVRNQSPIQPRSPSEALFDEIHHSLFLNVSHRFSDAVLQATWSAHRHTHRPSLLLDLILHNKVDIGSARKHRNCR